MLLKLKKEQSMMTLTWKITTTLVIFKVLSCKEYDRTIGKIVNGSHVVNLQGYLYH